MPKHKTEKSKALTQLLYDQFFQQAPFNVAIIDRDYNIIEANDNFTRYFGNWHNRKCFSVYKKQERPCSVCTQKEIFEDGRTRVVDTVVADKNSRWAHHVIQSAPLRLTPGGPVDYIVEITSVVTDTNQWQQEYNVLFDRVPCYITVIDEEYRIVRANESFRERFGDVLGQYCYKVYKRREKKCPRCPAARTFKDGKIHQSEQNGIGKDSRKIDYAVTTSPLVRGEERVAHVIEISTDVTKIKKLEKEVLEAERLAAVGQTVAGLAHSIKNILMGLEGGKYMISLGLKKDDRSMIDRGSDMLDRNFDKTTTLVKDFLSFSKGRLPQLKMTDPNALVGEIVDLYKDIAAVSNIELKARLKPKISPAPLDPDAIHTCLTNLVSNALDACLMGQQKGSEVVITTRDEKGKLIFEVSDNGSGMDYEIKKKIFTTFFTTKGGEGTGLGLLTTRKLVQEHGGKIVVESQKGKGSRFRMEFPRKRLEMLYRESE